MTGWNNRSVLAALGAALLFGAGTPAAKLLLGVTSPWLLAGLLYLGSGAGLLVARLLGRRQPVHLPRRDIGWLAAAIVAGGLIGPLLLMWGLTRLPASGASLLLNGEGVFTVLIAWFVFKEHYDRRIALGVALIVAGALVLGWPSEARFGTALPVLAVLGACAAWAIDNNLTRKVALADATFIAMSKGLAAGVTNIALAIGFGATVPGVGTVALAAIIGFFSYGVSLVLFVVALRGLGTARTGAYFSIAPFVGVLIALVWLHEPLTAQLAAAGVLMAIGVWLHVTESHVHEHVHGLLEHEHEHGHDEHHRHEHACPVEPGLRHTHGHRHEAFGHTHGHYPDAHHRHRH